MKFKAKNYFVLLCDSGQKKKDMLVCGVYASRKEAKEAAKEIKDCPAKHFIKKCSVEVKIKPA